MTYEALSDTEASYMAWIVVVPPSARHPQVRFQVCYQEGKRHRSAGIFLTQRGRWPRSGRWSAANVSRRQRRLP
jgi:hypothetical protein